MENEVVRVKRKQELKNDLHCLSLGLKYFNLMDLKGADLFNSDFEKYLDFYIKETNRISEELEKLN
jgi:hypothetical protein